MASKELDVNELLAAIRADMEKESRLVRHIEEGQQIERQTALFIARMLRQKKRRELVELMAAVDLIDDFWIPSVVALISIDPIARSIAEKLDLFKQMTGRTSTPFVLDEIWRALDGPKLQHLGSERAARMKAALKDVQALYRGQRNAVVHEGRSLEEEGAWEAVSTVTRFYEAFRGVERAARTAPGRASN